MQRSIKGATSAIALALTAVAGCGGSEREASSPSSSTMSPLSELLGYREESPEESRRKQLEVENLTAECMREEGWEYQPVDWAAQQSSTVEPDEAWGSDAFGEKYGYGIVWNYEQWEEGQLRGDGEAPIETSFVDPNQDYVDSLSEDERTEYYESLYGPAVVATSPGMAIDTGDGDTGDGDTGDGDTTADTMTVATAATSRAVGCNSQASEQVYASADPTRDNPDLQERLNDFYQQLEDDPRVTGATEAWAKCMTDELGPIEIYGRGLESIWDANTYVEQLKQEALGLRSVEWDGQEEIDDMYSAWSDGNGNGVAFVGKPVPIPEDDLEALRRRELDIWKVDKGCQESSKVNEVRHDAEVEFVQQLREEFPELGDGS